MNKKRILTVIIAFTMLASTTACTQPANVETTASVTQSSTETSTTVISEEETSTTEETTAPVTETTAVTVADPDSLVIVTLPEGWEKVDGSVLQHQYMKGIASFMLKTEPLYESTELPDVVEEAMGYMEDAFENVTRIGEAESLTIAGQDAMKITFTADIAGMSMQYTYFFLYIGGELYVGTLATLADDYANMEADFEQIMTSGISIA